jgi:hypothetical protein
MKSTCLAIVMAVAGICGAGTAAAAGGDAKVEAKAAYGAARDAAEANFKIAHGKCDALAGNAKDVCVAEAKADRVHAEASAQAQYKNTLRAYTRARIRIADANHEVDKTRCAALAGNDKDVCVKRADSTHVAARADAKADKKVIEARSNAREDKRIAEYKVASEKCDALAGTAKDHCVSAAKAQFGY